MMTPADLCGLLRATELMIERKIDPAAFFDSRSPMPIPPSDQSFALVVIGRFAAVSALTRPLPEWQQEIGKEDQFLYAKEWFKKYHKADDWETGLLGQVLSCLVGNPGTCPGANFRTVADVREQQLTTDALLGLLSPTIDKLLTLAKEALEKLLETFYGFLLYNEQTGPAGHVGKSEVKARFGHLAGVPVGKLISRTEATGIGLHMRHQGSIHARKSDGCFSLLIAEGYDEDGEDGEAIIFTGVGGTKGEKRKNPPRSIDQLLRDVGTDSMENAALVKSHETGWPVRVIVGSKSNISYRPQGEKEYLYVGLFRVHEVLRHRNVGGHEIMRFKLVYFDMETTNYIRKRRFTIEQARKAETQKDETPKAETQKAKTAARKSGAGPAQKKQKKKHA
ncbi:hypothetical protein TWF696_007631 [Orbilia brochopaga]|uniref:YDG domain-containing protein n=1 Tax=Orbilia brochopaga TaxID=3140254 RepID=A0AAV9UN36_9PEZI